MADNKGDDTRPAETGSGSTKPGPTGPVKPPVLDLKARQTDAAKPGAKSVPPKSVPPKPEEAAKAPAAPPVPPVVPRAAATPAPTGLMLGAGIVGGAIGLAAAYGLAWFGMWPETSQPAPQADPRIAQFATAIPELETVTQTTQAELATLNQRIVSLETAEAGVTPANDGAPVDLSGVESEIAALAARLDALDTAPSTDTGDMDGLRRDLSALTARIDEVAARVGTAEAGLRTLDTTVSQATATIAEQPSDIGAVLQLPLILSGFETAFATGRPYETELGALRAALPEANIPTDIANNATTGITRPDVIASRFATVLPNMLAGRPANPDAEWQAGVADWFAAAIALRPTGEIAGDSPEAVISRLEGAIARRDFVEAQSLLASLPAPMLAAAEDVPALVAGQAEAARFLETLRTSALTGEATP